MFFFFIFWLKVDWSTMNKFSMCISGNDWNRWKCIDMIYLWDISRTTYTVKWMWKLLYRKIIFFCSRTVYSLLFIDLPSRISRRLPMKLRMRTSLFSKLSTQNGVEFKNKHDLVEVGQNWRIRPKTKPKSKGYRKE